jgi:hypothetical protein
MNNYGFQPKKKSNTGLVIGLIAAVLVILIGVVGVTLYLRDGDTGIAKNNTENSAPYAEPLNDLVSYINNREEDGEKYMRLFIPDDAYDKFESMINLTGTDINKLFNVEKLYNSLDSSHENMKMSMDIISSEELSGSDFDEAEKSIKSLTSVIGTDYEIEEIRKLKVKISSEYDKGSGTAEADIITYCVDGKWYLDAKSLSKLGK